MNQITPKDIMAQRRGEAASQATSIEQSRAVAEVQAAVVVAQQRPRDEVRALAKAVESCKMPEVAEKAFFKFPRGGQSVSGETIHLAVELARCWGNISYGIMELDRDDSNAQSEMLAFAWDLEANTQSRMTFIVPHKRDKRGGAETLTDMRDIYENNANNGARRLRECIFRVLPPFLKDAAKATCFKTLQGSGEKPLAVRLNEMVDAFAKIGIARERIEAKVGAIANLGDVDLANLAVSYQSIRRNEISADEEFPKQANAETARILSDRVAATKAEATDQSQSGEPVTLESALAEIAAAKTPAEVNERVAALEPHLGDQASDLRSAAMDRVAELDKPSDPEKTQ